MERRADPQRRLCCATHPLASQVAALSSSYLFRDLSAAVLQDMLGQAQWLHFDRNQPVYQVGDLAVAIYIVHDGQLKERMLTADGDEAVTELLTPSALFGEPALFAPERTRVVDIIALETSHVIAIPRPVLIRILEHHPPVAMRLIEALAMETRVMAIQIVNAGYLRVRDRLITALLDLADTHGTPDGTLTRISLTLNQTLLAGMIHATRENVSRALTELTATGAITIHGTTYRTNTTQLRDLINTNPPIERRNKIRP
jgi:CRP-like cAMP-binding protein